MNLLITGGLGFIGSNFINKIINNDKIINVINFDKVSYCSNFNNIHSNVNESIKYKFIKGNLLETSLIEYILKNENITHIIHFAAQSHVDNSYSNSLEFTRDNVLGTHSLLEAIKNINIAIKLIHFSTDEVYGESINHNDIKIETSLLQPTNPYAASKASAEMYVNSYIKSYNLNIIITRCNNVYGPNQHIEKIIPKFTHQLNNNLKCTIQGDGTNKRNFIHILDVVDAILLLLFQEKYDGIYNIGCNNEYSVLDIAKILIKNIKKTDNFEKYIEYIEDRPFNDKLYNIESTKLQKLGWIVKHRNSNIMFIKNEE